MRSALMGLVFAATSCSTGPEQIPGPDFAVSTEDSPTAESADRNGNSVVCRKIPPTTKKFTPIYTDDSGDPLQPCPPGFEAVGSAG